MCSLNFGDDASVKLDMHQFLNEPINNNEINGLKPLMNEGETALEDELPALRDRITGMVADPACMNGECLEPVMNEKEAGLEYDVPALQDRVTGMVVDPLCMNETNENEELDMKFMCDAFHELEGGAEEFKTLGLIEDSCEILCTPENQWSKASCENTLNIARNALMLSQVEFLMKTTLLTILLIATLHVTASLVHFGACVLVLNITH